MDPNLIAYIAQNADRSPGAIFIVIAGALFVVVVAIMAHIEASRRAAAKAAAPRPRPMTKAEYEQQKIDGQAKQK